MIVPLKFVWSSATERRKRAILKIHVAGKAKNRKTAPKKNTNVTPTAVRKYMYLAG